MHELSSSSLLFTQKNNRDYHNSSPISTVENPEEEQVKIWSDTDGQESNSFLKLLKRFCTYWPRILSNKIRLVFTLIMMSMINITTRIACFTRQRTPSSLTTPVTSSSLKTLEEDSSQTLLLLDNTSKPNVDLPSLESTKMAHILVHQQRTHRSSNISIHPTTSTKTDSKLPMTHSVDERLFLQDSTQLINLLTRFASEPHMSKCQTQSTNSHGHFSKFALSTPVSNSYEPVTKSENEEIFLEDIYSNCDKLQPVSISLNEDFDSDKTDNITIVPLNPTSLLLSEQEQQTASNDEDTLYDISPSINNNDLQCERHFRRRKRRSSLTKTSQSNDDTQSTVDLLEKIDINQQQSQDNEGKTDDHTEETNAIETKTSENGESNGTVTDDNEKSAPVSRYRGRRLRHRFYRHSASVSSPPEVPSNISPQFYLPHEVLNFDSTKTHTSPPTSPITLSPLPSPTLTTHSTPTTPNGTTGGLKRINSLGVTKKNVRFADSIGRQLTQVQYIHSSSNDDSKELPFLFDSSLLSSSPPSFTKNYLYLPNKSRLEHKPWSFDVALTPNQQSNDISLPRRFFCLYRQPDSEHPDIYLHEIWKSQIKLEHADIPCKCSSTGEQQLLGTLWVTNASFYKHVSVKYTFNRWLNTYEHEAQHRRHSNDFRNIDQFEFSITIPSDVDRIDFVLRYCVNGQEFWDNNDGKNYTLQTESAYTPSTTISLPHDCDFNEMRFY